MAAVQGWVTGRVQGVYYRDFVRSCAEAESLQGYAKNLADGRVEVLLVGDEQGIARVKQQLARGPALARVDDIHWQPVSEPPLRGFAIR